MNPSTQSYKQTPIQKLLASNAKWWYVIRYYRNSQLTYNSNSILHSLASIGSFLLMILVWYISLNGNPVISFNQILTYFFVVYIYSGLTPMWISEMLGYKIYGGNLTSYLMRPNDIFWIGVCEMLGRGVITASILIILPFIVILPFFWSNLNFPTSLVNYFALLSFLPISFFIKYCIDFIVGCASFWIINNGGLIRTYSVLLSGLDGTRIPLKYLSNYISYILFLPTAFIIYYPVELFLHFDLNNYLYAFSGGIAWCVTLYFLAKWIFKIGLKRNEAVGL